MIYGLEGIIDHAPAELHMSARGGRVHHQGANIQVIWQTNTTHNPKKYSQLGKRVMVSILVI